MKPKIFYQIITFLDTKEFIMKCIKGILADDYEKKVIIYLFEDNTFITKNLFKSYTETEKKNYLKSFIDRKIINENLDDNANPYDKYLLAFKNTHTATANLLKDVELQVKLTQKNIIQILLPTTVIKDPVCL